MMQHKQQDQLAVPRAALHLEHLATLEQSTTHVLPHPAKACLASLSGGFALSSAEGEVTTDLGARDWEIEVGTWSPCGNFLWLGDSRGRLRLIHAPSQREIWLEHAGEEDPTSAEQNVFCSICCLEEDPEDALAVHSEGEGRSQWIAAVLVLLSGGRLLSCSGLPLRALHEDLSQIAAAEVEGRVVAFRETLLFRAHALPNDTRMMCAAASGLSWSSLDIFSCSNQELSSYELMGGILEQVDMAEVPEAHYEVTPTWTTSGGAILKDSPVKRRRVSPGGTQLSDLLTFDAWRPTNDLSVLQSNALLCFTYRRPGSVILVASDTLLEVYRWNTPKQADILSATLISLPAVATSAPSASPEDPRPVPSLSIALTLSTFELLVCSFPKGSVLLSLSLTDVPVGLHPSGPIGAFAVVAAPPLELGAKFQAEAAGAEGHSVPITALAYVAVNVEATDGPSATPARTLLSALRVAESSEHGSTSFDEAVTTILEDRTVDLAGNGAMSALAPVPAAGSAWGEAGVGDSGEVPVSEVSRLRRQLELLLERAGQGSIALSAEAFLRWARPLLLHIPGFVVVSATLAPVSSPKELRTLLASVHRLLQEMPEQTGYDAPKGMAKLAEELARLSTFERLCASLALPSKGDRNVSLAYKQRSSLDGGSCRRTSFTTPSKRPSTGALDTSRSSKRRHSLPSYREARASLGEEDAAAALSMSNTSADLLFGPDFIVGWKRFRQVRLPDLALDLLETGWPSEALGLVSRHSTDFSSEEIMRLLERLPLDLPAELQRWLPQWILQDILPSLSTRGQILQWTISRARALEQSQQSPDQALALIRTVGAPLFSNALGPREDHDGCSVQHEFDVGCGVYEARATNSAALLPRERVQRASFWAGSLVVGAGGVCQEVTEGLRTASGDETTRNFLKLAHDLEACYRIRTVHGLGVRLEDLRDRHFDQRLLASLLDRVPAPDLLAEEVRVHVAPYCEWKGLDLDTSLQEYLMDMMDSICGEDGELSLVRAATVLALVSSVPRRSELLRELLKRCSTGRASLPAEVQSLLTEAETWPEAQRSPVHDQIAILEVQQLLRKHGLGGAQREEFRLSRQCLPWYNQRIVQHLLSRVGDSGVSLQDALSMLDVSKTMGRPEALFLRLSHIAAALEEEPIRVGDPPVLERFLKESEAVLAAARSIQEQRGAVSLFLNYCIDVLGEYAGGIESCPSEAAVQAWKSSSGSLCDFLLHVLKRLAANEAKVVFTEQRHDDDDDDDEDDGKQLHGTRSSWCEDNGLDLISRLRRLQKNFDLYLDPLVIQQATFESKDEDEGSFSEEAQALFRLRARHWLDSLGTSSASNTTTCNAGATAERQRAATAAQQGAQQPGCSMPLPGLLRLGALLGLSQDLARDLLMKEAISQCSFSVVLEHLSCSLYDDDGDIRSTAGDLVLSMLKRLTQQHAPSTSSATASAGPTQAKLFHGQLETIQEAIKMSLRRCPTAELPTILQLSREVAMAKKVLECSDAPELSKSSEVEQKQEGEDDAEAQPLIRWRQSYSSLREVPLLIPVKEAFLTSLAFLSQRLSGEPAGTSELFSLLRRSECSDLAASLVLQHPQDFRGSELRHLCKERAVRLLRAGNAVNNSMTIAFLGGLEVKEAVDLLVKALAYLRTGHQVQTSRLEQFAQLGCDLATLWKHRGLYAQMSQIRKSAKWTRSLKDLGVAFDPSQLFDPGNGLLDRNQEDQDEERLDYAAKVLPILAKKANFDITACREFAKDVSFSMKEATLGWAEACFLSASVVVLPGVVQELKRVDLESVEQHLTQRVLPLVSPYDYERLELVLGCFSDTQSHIVKWKQVLYVLKNHKRTSSPLPAETEHCQVRQSKLQEAQLTVPVDQTKDDCAQMKRRLPWHHVAWNSDLAAVWLVLTPALRSRVEVEELLPLCAPLGLRPDELYLKAFEAQTKKSEDDVDLEQVRYLLLCIEDFPRAWRAVCEAEESLPIGALKGDMAKLKVEVAQRRVEVLSRDPEQLPTVGSPNAEELFESARRQAELIETRWAFHRAGLEVFVEVLLHSGLRACICSLYFYAPIFLHWPGDLTPGEQHGHPPQPSTKLGKAGAPALSAELSKLAWKIQRMGLSGLQDFVDSICSRHHLSTKPMRQQIIEHWLRNPRWRPDYSPSILAEAEAHLMAKWDEGANEEAAGKEIESQTTTTPPGQLFRQPALERLCVERVVTVAYTKYKRCQDVPKETREDIKTRCIFLLRIVFTKETSVLYVAKCRALAVLFRIATLDDIAVAYRNPVAELCEIWKLYYYMDMFERLGAPQDFKRLHQCNKIGLARSLWRQHRHNGSILQVVTALCLDFSIHDARFWAGLLGSLAALKLHRFIGDTLVALQDHRVSALLQDLAFRGAVTSLLTSVEQDLSNWIASHCRETPPSSLTLLPHLLFFMRRDTMAEEVDLPSLGRILLQVARKHSLPESGIFRLAEAIFSRQHRSDLEARLALAGMGLEFLLCRAPGDEVDTVVVEDLLLPCGEPATGSAAARSAREESSWKLDELLLLPLLERSSHSARRLFWRGFLRSHECLQRVEPWLSEPHFEELLQCAVAQKVIQEPLQLAVRVGRLSSAEKLLRWFCAKHRVGIEPETFLRAALDPEANTVSESLLLGSASELLQALRLVASAESTGLARLLQNMQMSPSLPNRADGERMTT